MSGLGINWLIQLSVASGYRICGLRQRNQKEKKINVRTDCRLFVEIHVSQKWRGYAYIILGDDATQSKKYYVRKVLKENSTCITRIDDTL